MEFRRAFDARRGDGFAHLGGEMISLGCETRTVPAEYRWDGMTRGDDPAHPRVMFQATLAGWGRFEQQGRRWTVGPEMAFLAVLPSPHVYYLPAKSPEWSFFWFNFGHPWLVQRLTAWVATQGPVLPLPTGGRLFAQCRSLFEDTCRQRFEDAFAEEGALFEWMLALERHLHELAHQRSQRERLLAEVRRFTLAQLSRPFGIEELGRREGVSRSHFSHRFRGATGLAPAAYVLGIRLAEARRRLRETAAPLKDVAAATGFADANHFCKVFRRQFHLSPGAYRRQVS